MSKQQLVEELSAFALTSRRQTEAFLEALTEIACREAGTGFVLPGLCKFEVVERKAREGMNPRTGETMQIPATMVLKIRSFKQAREKAVACLDQERAGEALPGRPGTAYILPCPRCSEALEAETSMIGSVAECPFCEREFEVPPPRDPSLGVSQEVSI